MQIAKPYSLEIVTSSVPESSYPEYSSIVTYAIDARVKAIGEDSLVHEYESQANDNVGNPLTDRNFWIDLGATNRQRMLDSKVGTLTTATDSIYVELSASQYFDTIALVRLSNVQEALIEVWKGDDMLYSEVFDLSASVIDWSDYFFGDPTMTADNMLVTPEALKTSPEIFYLDSTVKITLTGSGEIGCGLAMVSRAVYLGDTLGGPTVSIEDYSTKETDEFGNTYLLERGYSDRAQVEFILPAYQADFVKRTLARYRATPVLYDCNNADTNFASLMIFGYYEDFTINLKLHDKAYCSLTASSLL